MDAAGRRGAAALEAIEPHTAHSLTPPRAPTLTPLHPTLVYSFPSPASQLHIMSVPSSTPTITSAAAASKAAAPAKHRTLNRAESFLQVVQENQLELLYCQALARRDAESFAECFNEDGVYRSFLVSTQEAAPALRAGQQQPQAKQEVSVSELPRFFSLLQRDIRDYTITFHSIAHSSTTTVLEYTLRGLWSGRLPSMTVGVFDQPIALRCIDTLRWDETHRRLQRVDVMMDRFEFLVQIGMAQARL